MNIINYVDSKTAIFDPIPPCRLCSKSSLGLPPSPYRDDVVYGRPLRVRSRLEKRTINLATAHKRNIIFLCSLMNPLILDAKGGFYSEMAAEFVIPLELVSTLGSQIEVPVRLFPTKFVS